MIELKFKKRWNHSTKSTVWPEYALDGLKCHEKIDSHPENTKSKKYPTKMMANVS